MKTLSLSLVATRALSENTQFSEMLRLVKKYYGDWPSFHYLSEIKGQEADIVMITKVEDARIASTLLPLNSFRLTLARFDISKNFSTDSGD